MIQICGDNNFENGIYQSERWSAPVIQSPEELAVYLRDAGIAGRRIAHVRSVGPAYNFSQEWMQNYAIAAAMKAADSKEAFPPIVECIPDGQILSRLMLVDKPVILEFDTGDTLGVLFDRGSEVRVGLNTLPAMLTSGPQAGNVDTDVLFSEAVGKRITGLEVGRRKDLPEDWLKPQGEDWEAQDTLIAYILFRLEGEVGLAFEPFKETGRVFLIGADKKLRPITFGQLRPALTLEPLGENNMEM